MEIDCRGCRAPVGWVSLNVGDYIGIPNSSDIGMSQPITLRDSSPVKTAMWSVGGRLRRWWLPQVGWAFIATIVGAVILWPLIQLELRAFSDGGGAFSRMMALPRFASTLRTTVVLAIGSSVLAVVMAVPLAWCAQMLPAPVRRMGQLTPLLPLLIPPVAAVTGWIFLLSPKVGYVNTMLRQLPIFAGMREGPFDIYTVTGIVLITGLLLTSFVYLFVQTGLQNMGEELEAAAAASGASPLRALFTITIPLLRPSILFAAGIVFLLGLGQFTVPLLLGRTSGTDVLTTEMFFLTNQYPIDYGLGAALGFPILVVGIVLVITQKVLLSEQRRYVVVSARSRYQPRQTRWWAALVVGLYGFVTTLLPLAALIYVSLSSFWTGKLAFTADALTTRHWVSVFNSPSQVGAIWTSLKASVGAVVIVIALGFACACALLHNSNAARPIRTAIDVFVTIPMAIPASLMGFGLLFAYSGPPFPLYGTTAVLVVAYVTLMIGYSTRLQFTTLLATGQEFMEASKTSGAGSIRSHFLIMFPMVRRGVGAAAALTFILLFHEFSASMMVRSVRTQVIGNAMYDAWNAGFYPEVAVLSLIMVIVTLLGVAAAVWIGGTDSLKKM